jgi:DNA-binding transcriptional LysR family regulator
MASTSRRLPRAAVTLGEVLPHAVSVYDAAVRAVNLSSVDLNLLVVFDTIMAERNVSRAAARLHLTQSAVSHSLTRLRTIVGDALFVRTPGGMVPTALAESISGRVHAALGEIQGVLTPGSAFEPSRSTQRFTLGMTDYVALVVMPALARHLQNAAPGVQLVAVPASSRASIGMIERGEVDVYIGAAVHHPPVFTSTSDLYSDESVCVARRGHPAFSRRLTAAGVLACAHLHVSPWGDVGFIDEILRRQRTPRRIALTVGHFLVAPAILERTDLVAILPRRVAAPMAKRYALAMRPSPFDLGESKISQTWHRRFDGDAGLRWLRDQVSLAVRSKDLNRD